ncbi:MAG: metalloregulator ArsR/SmtB family transcription factor [bacterium]|nr:metalloregulator ArsR/SmtB family transcription factor [bacterium]
MDQSHAVAALGALAQDTRLSVFRLLVQAGPDGMIAGEIAQKMGVPASTMSHHLATLERAGLLVSQRDSRLIHYAVDYAGMQRLLSFLLEDCCNGAPDLCGDLLSHLPCKTEPAR